MRCAARLQRVVVVVVVGRCERAGVGSLSEVLRAVGTRLGCGGGGRGRGGVGWGPAAADQQRDREPANSPGILGADANWRVIAGRRPRLCSPGPLSFLLVSSGRGCFCRAGEDRNRNRQAQPGCVLLIAVKSLLPWHQRAFQGNIKKRRTVRQTVRGPIPKANNTTSTKYSASDDHRFVPGRLIAHVVAPKKDPAATAGRMHQASNHALASLCTRRAQCLS